MLSTSLPVGSHQVSMALFQIVAAATIICPRLPNDPPLLQSIGGDLSRPFRKILLLVLAINVCKLLVFSQVTDSLSESGGTKYLTIVYFIVSSVESFGRSFLCLLTPYLLQCQLQGRINIHRPGQDLTNWLYLVFLLNLAGCFLVDATGNIQYWSIKKIGDAMSFPPVYKTVVTYNRIITQGGRYHDGRGNMTSQTLLVLEYANLAGTLVSAFGYYWADNPSLDNFTRLLRVMGAYTSMTRVLCHGMMINTIDEAHYLTRYASASTNEDGDDENKTTALVASA